MSDTTFRHRRAIAIGDAFGAVVYRPPTPAGHEFTDVDTGAVFVAADRSRYRRSAAFRQRRDEIFAGRRGCDCCGRPAAVLWAIDLHAMGCEADANTVVLCRHCNDRAFRARENLGLVA